MGHVENGGLFFGQCKVHLGLLSLGGDA